MQQNLTCTKYAEHLNKYSLFMFSSSLQFLRGRVVCGHVNVSSALAWSQVIRQLLRKQSFSFQLNGTLCFGQLWKVTQIQVFFRGPFKIPSLYPSSSLTVDMTWNNKVHVEVRLVLGHSKLALTRSQWLIRPGGGTESQFGPLPIPPWITHVTVLPPGYQSTKTGHPRQPI